MVKLALCSNHSFCVYSSSLSFMLGLFVVKKNTNVNMSFKSWFAGTNIGKFIMAPFGWWATNSSVEAELVAAYFTGVKILSENMAKMNPQVMDIDNKIIKDHPLNKLFLHHPNEYTNRQKFWKVLESRKINQGDGYAYIERKSGRADSFHLLDYSSVIGAKMTDKGILVYEVDFSLTPTIPKIGKENILAEDLIHMTFGQVDGIFGVKAVDILAMQTSVISRAQKTIDSFYANNATSNLALETTIDRASLATKLIESADDFTKKYVGEVNAGKPIRLPPNTKIVPIGQKFVDAQIIETQRFAREEISNLFGIPKSMFESTDNNESIEQQTRMFLSLTLTPIIEAYIAELEFKLLTANEVMQGIHIEYNTEKLIDTDTKTRVNMVTQLVSKGIISPNTGARKLGYETSDSSWADELWIQSQNNPISQYEAWGNNDLGKTDDKIDDEDEDEDEDEDKTKTK